MISLIVTLAPHSSHFPILSGIGSGGSAISAGLGGGGIGNSSESGMTNSASPIGATSTPNGGNEPRGGKFLVMFSNISLVSLCSLRLILRSNRLDAEPATT